MRRYVIIGSGAAGIAATEAIRSQDSHADIILVSEDRFGYYSRPGLAYLLSNEIPESGLFPFTKHDFNHLRISQIHAKASRLVPDNHTVQLQDGRLLGYDRLLLATGSHAVRMQVPGVELTGSVKLDNLEDTQGIIKLARRGKAAVVVGGGITALEIVEGLASRGVKVHYFLREDRYWSNVLDESESRVVEEKLREDGAVLHYRTELVEVMGNNGRVTGVCTKNGEVIRCDLVAIAIGVRPNIDLAVTGGLKTDRGVLVDEYMQTSAPDIFAAGDIGQVLDPKTGKSALDTLWSPARKQGDCAGLNMAGKSTSFEKLIPYNVTRLAGLTTTIIGTVGIGGRDPDMVGIARGDSEAWRETGGNKGVKLIAAQSEFNVNRLRLVFNDSTLIGAFIMGDQTLSDPLQHLIVQRADLSPIKNQLIQPNQPLSTLIMEFYLQWQGRNASRTPSSPYS